MANERSPDLSLFLDILHTLEAIDAPYVIIGAFAATVYGITRVTYDIDIVVNLQEPHIQALCKAYPSPRYYADPLQMRDSIRMGIMFNIIDSNRGEKADLVPLSMSPAYRQALRRRVRQEIEIADGEPLTVWCASPEDIIIGKLTAWAEGRSRKHETDIFEMLVFNLQATQAGSEQSLDYAYIETSIRPLGESVITLWSNLREAATRAV